MKLSMARVSVSSWTRQTSSEDLLAGDDLALAFGEVARRRSALHECEEARGAVGGDEFECVDSGWCGG